jgi:hypothetical protein
VTKKSADGSTIGGFLILMLGVNAHNRGMSIFVGFHPVTASNKHRHQIRLVQSREFHNSMEIPFGSDLQPARRK